MRPQAVMAPRALLVDDDVDLLRTYERILRAAGVAVERAIDGDSAVEAVRRGSFDVVLTDIDMPGMNGIDLLRAVRAHDLDLPVLLITGRPAVDTAVQAIEHGALRYLIKPIAAAALADNVRRAVQLRRMAAIKREASSLIHDDQLHVGDRVTVETLFERALAGLCMAYQPIVGWVKQHTYAWEALLRSNEPAMATPAAIFDAAERLGRLSELGRRIRGQVAAFAAARPDATIFVNLHPRDLLDDDLYSLQSPLSQVAARVVLEITERAALDDVADVRPRIASLRQIGFRVAIDDLGAGYAGLASFALLEPDVVKIDMSLVRDIHLHATKRKLVRSMVSLCHDLQLMLVVEGVETVAERDVLIELGCDLLQGYLFAKPANPPLTPLL